MTQDIKLGISACLLGQKVRFDGGHKLDRFLTETLGGYVQFVPVCPEMECGLGIPRESMRLVGNPQAPRLVTTRTGQDHTRRMLDWAAQKVKALEEENLCG
ncbi:MAG: 2-thiouracil desulfurase family protein, partial [Desulfobacterales bacterium]|nr:2-thiouracil desulfurase family protein [Desulfobacterales bacterium]